MQDEVVDMVDVRFCDRPGIRQHFTVPVSSFDQSVFADGLGFDGSSIRGFQAIHESDMQLFPDPTTAYPPSRPVALPLKSASDAATWLPKNKNFRCHYVARQISVKASYKLWVTQPEKDAMKRVLDSCPDQPTISAR